MRSTTTYKKWDIILVPFPFTDLTASKRRPALIVSPDEYNVGIDRVIAFITSNMNVIKKTGDYEIRKWKNSGLPKPSMIRMKFATIDKSIIIKTIGRLSSEDIKSFRRELSDFFTN